MSDGGRYPGLNDWTEKQITARLARYRRWKRWQMVKLAAEWTFIALVFAAALYLLLVCVSWLSVLTAQEVIIPPPQDCPARVLFVVDVSGSVDSTMLAAEVSYVRQTIQQLPFDGAEYKVIAFANGAGSMGWVRHPSPRREAQVMAWLSSRPVATNCTSYLAALTAMQRSLEGKPTTVVFVTDGCPDNELQTIVRALGGADATTELEALEEGAPPRRVRLVSWIFVGVGVECNPGSGAVLRRMAGVVGGGYVRVGQSRGSSQ